MSVEDVLSRRTRALLLDGGRAAAAAGTVARLLAPELGWTEEETVERAEHFARCALDELASAGVPLPPGAPAEDTQDTEAPPVATHEATEAP